MIKAEWTNNDALSAEQTTQTNAHNTLNALDCVSRQAAIEEVSKGCEEFRGVFKRCKDNLSSLPSAQPETCKYWDDESKHCALYRPSAQPEHYVELKREFIRMAQYIDVLLYCPDEQKETLNGFILRLAEFMPWTERD